MIKQKVDFASKKVLHPKEWAACVNNKKENNFYSKNAALSLVFITKNFRMKQSENMSKYLFVIAILK